MSCVGTVAIEHKAWVLCWHGSASTHELRWNSGHNTQGIGSVLVRLSMRLKRTLSKCSHQPGPLHVNKESAFDVYNLIASVSNAKHTT